MLFPVVLWNSILLSVSKEDVTHDGSAERHTAVNAVTGMLQQAACKAEWQRASLSLLQYPLDFAPAYLLPLSTWIRSCRALCRRSSVVCTRLARRAVLLGGRAALSPAPPARCKVLSTALLNQQTLSGMHRQKLALIH